MVLPDYPAMAILINVECLSNQTLLMIKYSSGLEPTTSHSRGEHRASRGWVSYARNIHYNQFHNTDNESSL